jgi:hypothetical protein
VNVLARESFEGGTIETAVAVVEVVLVVVRGDDVDMDHGLPKGKPDFTGERGSFDTVEGL